MYVFSVAVVINVIGALVGIVVFRQIAKGDPLGPKCVSNDDADTTAGRWCVFLLNIIFMLICTIPSMMFTMGMLCKVYGFKEDPTFGLWLGLHVLTVMCVTGITVYITIRNKF